MWISQQAALSTRGTSRQAVETGAVTVNQDTLAVLDGGERRGVSLCAPGGLCWRPRVGDSVLMLTPNGTGHPLTVGVLSTEWGDLEPGELRLQTENASLTLRNDGRIEVKGTLVTEEASE